MSEGGAVEVLREEYWKKATGWVRREIEARRDGQGVALQVAPRSTLLGQLEQS